MNRQGLISSALKTNADNPQYFGDDGLDTIHYILREFQAKRISLGDIKFIAKRIPFQDPTYKRFSFQLTPEEVKKIVGGVLNLHRRYFNVSTRLENEITEGLSHAVEHTIWNSAESALGVIEGDFGFYEKRSQLECSMWEAILGELYYLNKDKLPKDMNERLLLAIEKLSQTIKNREKSKELRRNKVSGKKS